MKLNDAVIDTQNWQRDANILETFLDSEIFFKITSATPQLQNGPTTVAPGQEIKLQTAKLPDGPMALFYTTKDHPKLREGFAGLPLRAAINMVLKTPGVNGMLLQSDKDAWVVVMKEALVKLRIQSSA